MSFFIALGATLLAPVLAPACRFLFFLPYLAGCCYRKSRLQTAAYAALCGGMIDCLSSSTRFGLYALTSGITLLICYPLKQQFFEDKLSTLPLLTFFFSLCFSCIGALLALLLAVPIALSWRWVFTDVFAMAIADALYGLICFALPQWLRRLVHSPI